MKFSNGALIMGCCLLAATATANAAEYEVGQKDKQFTEKQLTIKVGDTVKFTNEDPFFHNVFSLSDAKMFDLGSYAQGKSKSVVFDQAGKIEVECAIHPSMHMVIDVAE